MLKYYVNESVGVEIITHNNGQAIFTPFTLMENEAVEFEFIINQYVYAIYDNKNIRINLSDWGECFKLLKRTLVKEMAE